MCRPTSSVLGIGSELARVAVGGAVAEQHAVTGGDGRAVDLDVAGRDPAQSLHR